MRYPPCTITVSPFRARISQVLPPDLLNHTSTTPATRAGSSVRCGKPFRRGGGDVTVLELTEGRERWAFISTPPATRGGAPTWPAEAPAVFR